MVIKLIWFCYKWFEKFYVEKINIFGNFNTVEEVIRNNLIVDEGDPFNELLFNKSINKIKSLGIFKSVKSDILDGSNPNTSVKPFIEEQPTGSFFGCWIWYQWRCNKWWIDWKKL